MQILQGVGFKPHVCCFVQRHIGPLLWELRVSVEAINPMDLQVAPRYHLLVLVRRRQDIVLDEGLALRLWSWADIWLSIDSPPHKKTV